MAKIIRLNKNTLAARLEEWEAKNPSHFVLLVWDPEDNGLMYHWRFPDKDRQMIMGGLMDAVHTLQSETEAVDVE